MSEPTVPRESAALIDATASPAPLPPATVIVSASPTAATVPAPPIPPAEPAPNPSQPPIPTAPETFRVRCPDCGPQVVAVSAVRYVETGEGPAANRYVFACPECGARVRRPAGPELSEILRSSGVATLALHRGPGEAV